jgi:electron transport complex protein RnfG
MRELLKHMLLTATVLGLFAVIGTGLVAITFDATKEPIAASKRAAVLRSLHQLVPDDLHDNDIFTDVIRVTAPDAMGNNRPVTVYRARKGGENIAAVIAAVAPDGYSGSIGLLVAINYNGSLLGIRVVNHRETPGLGDAIDKERSDWVDQFNGKSLQQPTVQNWKVKKDGGAFDQLTGATITPRAVVATVKRTLEYYQVNRTALFADNETNNRVQTKETPHGK